MRSLRRPLVFALFVGLYFLYVSEWLVLDDCLLFWSNTFRIKRIVMPPPDERTRHFEQERIVLGRVGTGEHTTVVSAYFDFSNNSTKSHPNWQFLDWLGQFLRSCEAPLVMYTDRRTAAHMQAVRANMSYKTTLLIYDSIWSLMRELEIKRNKSYQYNYKHVQLNYSLPELFAIWNLKAYITQRASQMNPYKSQFFIYTDAGAWRDYTTVHWPDNNFVRQVQARIGDRMLLGQLRANEPAWHCWHAVIEGGFFAGTALALAQFESHYYAIHDNMLSKEDKSQSYVGKLK